MSVSSRVFLSSTPYPPSPDAGRIEPWRTRGWPCCWIGCASSGEPPFVAGFRCRLEVETDAVLRCHVSADERYELFLDGECVGRGGGERGDARHWSFETYDLSLTPGAHLLAARVWALGRHAPLAQMSAGPGFLFSPQEEKWIARIGSGVGPWETAKLAGHEFFAPPPSMEGVGGCLRLDGEKYPWGWETDGGTDADWQPAASLSPAADGQDGSGAVPVHRLEPAALPPMFEQPWRRGRVCWVAAALADPPAEIKGFRPVLIDPSLHLSHEAAAWMRLLAGEGKVTVPPGAARRILFDLEDYVCAYPEITVSGGRGGCIGVSWAEALYEGEELWRKGPRDETANRWFAGAGDEFLPDGGSARQFRSLWWRCGRYMEVSVRADREALTVERLVLSETRYPLEPEGRFESGDGRITALVPTLLRGLQMCAHETYVDCPYYEQLQYVGDAVLQALTGAQLTRDDRLWRRTLRLVDASRRPGDFPESRYPSRYGQSIPTFSLAWIGSVHDYAWWRGDPGFVRGLMPGVRATLDLWLERREPGGAVLSPPGWNFVDWLPGPPFWHWGVPPGAQPGGLNAFIHWRLIGALRRAADLEAWLGENEMAARWKRLAAELAARAVALFWSDEKQCFDDDGKGAAFSDHAQSAALLSGALDERQAAGTLAALRRADADAMRTSVFCAHDWFEAHRAAGRFDAAFDRLEQWFELTAMGFRTTPEVSDLWTTRSDCHAWSATPLYHFFASALGVRPAAFGYTQVEIAPQLGPLEWARGEAVHPLGLIGVDLRREERGGLLATVRLPAGLTGTLRHAGRDYPLLGDTRTIRCAGPSA